MPTPQHSSRTCRVDEVQRLRVSRGLSIEKLASKASVDRKTIERLFKGKRLAVETIGRIANALGTTIEQIIVDPRSPAPPLKPTTPSPFRYSLNVAGEFSSGEQAAELGRLGLDGVSRIQTLGATIHSHQEAMLVAQPTPEPPVEDGTHILVGLAWKGRSAECEHILALVRECDYEAFVAAVLDCTLDLRHFEPFGRLLDWEDGHTDPWAAIEATTPPEFVRDQHDRFFTIVPMPAAWEFLRPSDRHRNLHTDTVMFHCNRAAYIGAHHFQQEPPVDVSVLNTDSFLHVEMQWWHGRGFQKVAVAVAASRYTAFYRALRSFSVDLNDFKEFGVVLWLGNPNGEDVWEAISRGVSPPTRVVSRGDRFLPFSTEVLVPPE